MLSSACNNPTLAMTRAKRAGFNPRSLGNLAVWFDAGYSASIIKSGAQVIEWRDRSGNGRHANTPFGNNVVVAAAARLRRASLLFDGARLALAATYTPPADATVYQVWTQFQSLAGSHGLLNVHNISTTGTGIYTDHDGTNVVFGFGGPGGNYSVSQTSAEPDIETPQIGVAQKNSGAVAFRLNGVNYSTTYSAGTLGNGAFNSVGSVGSYPSKHRVGEILVFEAVHDAATVQRVEAYLAAKWIP